MARGVQKSQVMKRNTRTRLGSEEIWEASKEIIEENVRKGYIGVE